jgi:hypothetical protein
VKENFKERKHGPGMREETRKPTYNSALAICAACGNYIPLGVKFWTDDLRGWCSIKCTHLGTMIEGEL